jgi:hypothetical protein
MVLPMFGRKTGSGKSAANRANKLQSDFNLITGYFKSHPFISIKETVGVPAEKYVILYRVEGLQLIGKAIEAKNEHVIEILLPPGYPDAPPVCKRVSPVFHPNMSAEIIDIRAQWTKDMPVPELIIRIGEMIAYQKYATDGAINSEAGKWAQRNTDLLPLSNINLHVRATETPAAVKEAAGTKVHEQPVSDNIFVNEIAINDPDDRQETGPDDARKTEGIVIEHDTAPLEVDHIANAAAEPVTAIMPAITPASSPETQKPSKPEPSAAGTTFGADAAIAQKPPSPPMILFQFFYCPYCGNKNNKDANFCMTCGARLKPVKKTNIFANLSIVAMIVIPVAILAAGISMIVTHGFFQGAKEPMPIAEPAMQPVHEKPGPAKQEQVPAAAADARLPDEPLTSTAIAEKMAKPIESSTHKTQNVFAPERLTEQQKTEKIAFLLQNARLYINIGSYDDAIKRYREVLKINPTNFEASMGLDSAQEAKDKAPPRLPSSGQSDD